MYNPVSSYRIQFNSSFTLDDLEHYLAYLVRLGVKSIYASPVFRATPGSSHGYDVTDPLSVNPETGTDDELQRLSLMLKENGMGWIQDIVPNHMAYHPDNRWIWDLLEKGPASEYAGMFDVEPEVAGGKEKLMLPFLGSTADRAIHKLELQVVLHRGSIAVKYFDNLYPASFESFRSLLTSGLKEAPDCLKLVWNRYRLQEMEADRDFLNGDWEVIKDEIAGFCESDPEMQAWAARILKKINSSPPSIITFLDQQHYEPCYWKETSDRINYRRFFTVNGLICLRSDNREMVEKHHALIRELAGRGVIDGLRVDHVDGLAGPAQYLHTLREIAGSNKYIVVEKILERGEKIPGKWQVEGTSGYDFLALVNNLMVNRRGYTWMKKFYRRFTGEKADPGDIIYECKKLILETHMNGETRNIFKMFEELSGCAKEMGVGDWHGRKDITPGSMKEALCEFMLAYPVYRLYPEEYPLPREIRQPAAQIFSMALKRNRHLKNELHILEKMMLAEKAGERYFSLLNEFFTRLNQYTGPLSAKGVEDTAMYRYSCFIAGNEVGDHLYDRGMAAEDFHKAMSEKLEENPLAMNCTSTHDTKRGEDVRARLNALGDLYREWKKLVAKWERHNRKLKKEVPARSSDAQGSSTKAMARPGMGKIEMIKQQTEKEIHSGKEPAMITAPSAVEEYFIYQTIAGTLPFDGNPDNDYKKRIDEYIMKALREAKQNSSWEEPDEQYERAVCSFAGSLLKPGSTFFKTLLPFHGKLAAAGIVNSLSQLSLKCCSPGIPDIYRGTELWDLSLVDPDNRRPADLGMLDEMLTRITGAWHRDKKKTTTKLLSKAGDGRIKLLLTSLLLNIRKQDPDLFTAGDYIPLATAGRLANRILAFARKRGNRWLLCIVPIHAGAQPILKGKGNIRPSAWKDTRIILPAGAPVKWENRFTGQETETVENTDDRLQGFIPVKELFSDLPVAVLSGSTLVSGRSAGILLHISSLPGRYGTGDFGREARRFVDFLSRASQTYWQTLPLSPVTAMQAWSPYSSPSAFALNTLLIDPEQLYFGGLIRESDLEAGAFRKSDKVNHKRAGEFRAALLEKAWENARETPESELYIQFEEFCRKEAYWLDDYSLFTAISANRGGNPWYRWPAPLRDRHEKAMKTLRYELADKIMPVRFSQFIAYRQWMSLKQYANAKGIRIFGDIPFYVSYNSADVWANRPLFNLRESGKMKTVAGVPPDYFDSNGQLWNMPVYDWQRLKDTGYEWWLSRLAKNLELFDLLRLDHFRAFSAFWEVPAGSRTAAGGKWTRGPGAGFLEAVKDKFPSMPFVAEDLGDIDSDVYELRDMFGLPGMQVLQFSFGRDMASSIHTPHNHKVNSLVYTGTHDNNTIRGWFDSELDKAGKARLADYAGRRVKGADVHHVLTRMAHASAAATAIVPFQDYMGLGRRARINTPATARGNWQWKLKDLSPCNDLEDTVSRLTVLYNRGMNDLAET
ncbi:MAG: malto-oligosyltrehalose synthase [Marinilabiliales bacterium]|nr:MAG: malto-oligosyltrehalose synthase [Marinilabiliales bacterium]